MQVNSNVLKGRIAVSKLQPAHGVASGCLVSKE